MDFSPKPWLEGFLNALGPEVHDIDYVFCTHLHIDHTGWNTHLVDGRWVPTFPKAKYVFHKKEYEYWESAGNIDKRPRGNNSAVWKMNCQPIVEAKPRAADRRDLLARRHAIPVAVTRAHAVHCCVHIRSKGHEAIVLGDMMHHAIQCREPDWSTGFDTDPKQAARRVGVPSEIRRSADDDAADALPESDRGAHRDRPPATSRRSTKWSR